MRLWLKIFVCLLQVHVNFTFRVLSSFSENSHVKPLVGQVFCQKVLKTIYKLAAYIFKSMFSGSIKRMS